MEHEALIKAQADFSQIEIEVQALKAAHTQSLEEAQAKLEAAESKAALAQSLETQLAELRVEKEDAVAKLSEIEVEVLELKESQETVEDERAKTAARIATLEQELSQAIAATQQAIDNALAKEAEYTSQADGAKALHEGQLKTISDAHAETASQLEALKVELEAALTTHRVAGEEHSRQLGEAEEGYLRKQAELSEEIRRITTELEVCAFIPPAFLLTRWCFRVKRLSITPKWTPSKLSMTNWYKMHLSAPRRVKLINKPRI